MLACRFFCQSAFVFASLILYSVFVIVLNTFEDFCSSILTVNWRWLLKDVGKLKSFVPASRDSPMTVCLLQAMARSVKMPQRSKKLVCVERNFGLVGRWGCAWQCNWKQGTKKAIFSSLLKWYKLQTTMFVCIIIWFCVFSAINGCNQFIRTFVASWWFFFGLQFPFMSIQVHMGCCYPSLEKIFLLNLDDLCSRNGSKILLSWLSGSKYAGRWARF